VEWARRWIALEFKAAHGVITTREGCSYGSRSARSPCTYVITLGAEFKEFGLLQLLKKTHQRRKWRMVVADRFNRA
jgi:hypothetical protein